MFAANYYHGHCSVDFVSICRLGNQGITLHTHRTQRLWLGARSTHVHQGQTAPVQIRECPPRREGVGHYDVTVTSLTATQTRDIIGRLRHYPCMGGYGPFIHHVWERHGWAGVFSFFLVGNKLRTTKIILKSVVRLEIPPNVAFYQQWSVLSIICFEEMRIATKKTACDQVMRKRNFHFVVHPCDTDVHDCVPLILVERFWWQFQR